MRLSLRALEAAQQVRHFDGAHGRFCTFIAHFAARAIESLFHCVGGEDAVGDRDAGVFGDGTDAFGTLSGNVIEVGRVAADNAAQADDCIGIAKAGKFCNHHWHLPGTGHFEDFEVFGFGTGAGERIECAVEQTIGHEAVETADNDGHAQSSCGAKAFADLDFIGVERGHIGYERGILSLAHGPSIY